MENMTPHAHNPGVWWWGQELRVQGSLIYKASSGQLGLHETLSQK